MRRGDAFLDAGKLVEAGERNESIGVKRVEADGEATEARGLEIVDLLGEENAVGREREVIRTSAARSRRSSGSPPVRRSRSTPSPTKTSTSALISSKCSRSSRGSQT